MDDLPAEAHAYLARLSKLVGRPVEVVSVGPDREQTIFSPASRWPARGVARVTLSP